MWLNSLSRLFWLSADMAHLFSLFVLPMGGCVLCSSLLPKTFRSPRTPLLSFNGEMHPQARDRGEDNVARRICMREVDQWTCNYLQSWQYQQDNVL